MSLIQISHLTFGYDGSPDTVFGGVSFQMDTDWKLGLAGRNGRGKTTLMRLLQGQYEYTGTISAPVQFDYFPHDVPDASKDTLEALFDAVGDFEQWALNRELSLLDVPEEVLYRPFNTLSHGERTKLLLATLFLRDGRFLLIDEPTNHLDSQARDLVGHYLRSKKGFILISHDRAFLDEAIDHIMVINKTDIEIQKGNFSAWWRGKQRRDDFERAQDARLRADIQRMSAAARRTATWSDAVEKSKKQPLSSGLSGDKGYIGHKSAKMMKRSKNIEKRQQSAIEEKSGLLKNIEEAGALLLKPLQYHAERLVSLDDVSVSYGDKTVCRDVRFEICRGDRIALTGKNGSGKSSLLKLLLGQSIPHGGTRTLGSGLIISHIPQDTSFLRGSLRDYIREEGQDESLFKAVLRQLDFSREQFDREMEYFSDGQRKKVLIAGSLCRQAHLYLWDEPLNYIDVFSRIQIEELLLAHTPTMLFVEHDMAFVRKIATKTVEL